MFESREEYNEYIIMRYHFDDPESCVKFLALVCNVYESKEMEYDTEITFNGDDSCQLDIKILYD